MKPPTCVLCRGAAVAMKTHMPKWTNSITGKPVPGPLIIYYLCAPCAEDSQTPARIEAQYSPHKILPSSPDHN